MKANFDRQVLCGERLMAIVDGRSWTVSSIALNYAAYLWHESGGTSAVVNTTHDHEGENEGGAIARNTRSRFSRPTQVGLPGVTYFDAQTLGKDELLVQMNSCEALLMDGRAQVTTEHLGRGAVRVFDIGTGFVGGGEWFLGEGGVQALSGFRSLLGWKGEAPVELSANVAAAQLSVHALSAALALSVRQDRRSSIEVGATAVLATYLRMYGLLYQYYGINIERNGRRAPGSGGQYPFGIFRCQDGYIVMIGRYEEDWNKLLDMMGNPAWGARPEFRSSADRTFREADRLDTLIEQWTQSRTRDELTELGLQYQVAVAPVRSPREVTQDEQLRFRDFFKWYKCGSALEILPTSPAIVTSF